MHVFTRFAAPLLALAAVSGCLAPDFYAGNPQIESIRTELHVKERVPVIIGFEQEASGMLSADETLSRLLHSAPAFDLQLDEDMESIDGTTAIITANGLDVLTSDPGVRFVNLDVGGDGTLQQSSKLIGVNDVTAGLFLNAPSSTRKRIKIAVFDSGLTLEQTTLRRNVVAEECFCEVRDGDLFEGCCPDGSTRQSGTGAAADDSGHGTHTTAVLATIGGTPLPAGPDKVRPGPTHSPVVELVLVKILDKDNRFGRISTVVSAFDWLAQNHPDTELVVAPFGTEHVYADDCTADREGLAMAIERLSRNGTAVFASSGNDGRVDGMRAPACLPDALAVGAVYDSNVGANDFHSGEFSCIDRETGADQIACYSNASGTLDFLAPGSHITAEQTAQGTSAAVPHVAGAAALLLAADPAISPEEAAEILSISGKRLTDGRLPTAVSPRQTPRIDVAVALRILLIRREVRAPAR